jgi:hypothetical protein
MELETFLYSRTAGWSAPRFPDLDSDTTLLVLFGAPEFLEVKAPIAELSSAFPRAKIVGCSTAGEIFGTDIHDESISVAAVRFADSRITTAFAAIDSAEDSFRAGADLAHQLEEPSLRAIVVLSDGTNVNGSELVRGLNSVFQGKVPVSGGLAGDGTRFRKTWVICNGSPICGGVSAVGFYGDRLHIGHGSRGGWDIFGPIRTVTRSKGNILYELDGKPALKLYKEYLGDRASGLPATALLFPLALYAGQDEEKMIVRTILSVDEASQSMVFAGDIPQGVLVRLMRANFDRLIEGAAEAGRICRETGGSGAASPRLSLAISCVGRRLILGERIEEELEVTLEALPEASRQIGFYSYGEISPNSTGDCDLHNQTMTLTSIGEDA